mmetsp:Transcript_29127/g.33313  ORF Transcript_29127/g.33313 Transcript_29127/m.33313 type:complete len:111 (-) Transcript_29127:63-395(-)
MFVSKSLMKTKLQAPMTMMARNFVVLAAEKRPIQQQDTTDIYFSEHERNTVKNLLEKMTHYNTAKKSKGKASMEEEAEDHTNMLLELFEKHGIKDDNQLIKDLKAWKESK